MAAVQPRVRQLHLVVLPHREQGLLVVDPFEAFQRGLADQYIRRAPALDLGTVPRDPRIRQPTHVLRHVQQAIEHCDLEFGIKETDQRIRVPHAVPQAVIVGEVPNPGVPRGKFIIHAQIAGHTQ